MAKIKIKTAYLHNTFLLSGKNFGPTIESEKITGIDMVYDQIEKELWLTYKGITGFAPSTNVSFLVPLQTALENVLQSEPPTIQSRAKKTAQVSTPTGHVFEGPGHGQTGQK